MERNKSHTKCSIKTTGHQEKKTRQREGRIEETNIK